MNQVLKSWFLNLVIGFPVRLCDVRPSLDGKHGSLNVRSLRGFTLDEAITWLEALGQEGLIAFTHQVAANDSRNIDPSGVRHLMDRPLIERELSFQLTSAGGSAWESMAVPRWDEMDDGEAIPCDENGKIVGWDWTFFSQSRERLMAVLGWFPQIQNGEQIDLDTVTWRFAADYQVKYWKRLPNVHVVRFRTTLTDPRQTNWNFGVDPEWFRTWDDARSNWYRHPWEMEGWPPEPR